MALSDAASDVTRLNREDGPSLLTQGSTALIQTLLANELVDEINIFTFPVVLGRGNKLFGDGPRPATFRLMLPSPVPMLWRYRQAVARTSDIPLGWLTMLEGVGYFFVWSVFGIAAFLPGAALAAVAMQDPGLVHAVPLAIGIVVQLGGAIQFTA